MAINRAKNESKVKWIYIFTGVLLVALVVGGFFAYQEYKDLKTENQRLSNPDEAAKTDIENTKSAVTALIEVPTDEEPTIANVVDVSKLSDQAFFKNAQNGDKLLVYQNAKKAILFRPSTNKIIEVSTISLGDEDAKKAPAADKTKPQASQPEASDTSESGVDTTLPGLE